MRIKAIKYQRTFILLCFIFNSVILFAQTEKKSVVFYPVFGSSKLLNDTFYKFNVADSIQISSLKFYISKIELLNKNKTVWQDSSPFHLIDAFDEKTLSVKIPSNITYTKIKFYLGIDSVTNVSGVMGGDLDPTKGMYWTWQSGYINFKLEGTSNLCKTRHNEFQFHLGGYQYPFNCLQTIFIDVLPNQNIEVEMDVLKLFNLVNLSQQNHIMSPCLEALNLSETVINSLSIKK